MFLRCLPSERGSRGKGSIWHTHDQVLLPRWVDGKDGYEWRPACLLYLLQSTQYKQKGRPNPAQPSSMMSVLVITSYSTSTFGPTHFQPTGCLPLRSRRWLVKEQAELFFWSKVRCRNGGRIPAKAWYLYRGREGKGAWSSIWGRDGGRCLGYLGMDCQCPFTYFRAAPT